YAYVKCQDKWYECNDSICYEISVDNVITSSAYVLFYERVKVNETPTTPPNNVNLSRNIENNALLATWDAVETTPPEGEVAFYQVEFKDMRSSIANTLFIDPGFSFSSIFNVSNAQGYQVRDSFIM
uniref:USP domain-containing protein n=1 Tax=Amphimedon queenslandica TaxID=400682 RepID=A0A1X7SU90_AMPQE